MKLITQAVPGPMATTGVASVLTRLSCKRYGVAVAMASRLMRSVHSAILLKERMQALPRSSSATSVPVQTKQCGSWKVGVLPSNILSFKERLQGSHQALGSSAIITVACNIIGAA